MSLFSQLRPLIAAKVFLLLLPLLFISFYSSSQKPLKLRHNESGVFSLGIRTGISLANNNGWYVGQGWGVQSRIRLDRHINTEWYTEFLHGGYSDQAVRTDGHIGALVLLNPQRRPQRVNPFLALGPNADYIRLRDRLDKNNVTRRWAIGFQTAIGFHINITRRSDLTFSTGYLIHFGKELTLTTGEAAPVQLPQSGSGPDGNFLVNVSMNYKMADLWKRLKF